MPANAPAFDALGYRDALDVLESGLAESAAAVRLARHTVQYAKRQMTWLRGEARRVEIAMREVGEHESPGQVARDLAERCAQFASGAIPVDGAGLPRQHSAVG